MSKIKGRNGASEDNGASPVDNPGASAEEPSTPYPDDEVSSQVNIESSVGAAAAQPLTPYLEENNDGDILIDMYLEYFVPPIDLEYLTDTQLSNSILKHINQKSNVEDRDLANMHSVMMIELRRFYRIYVSVNVPYITTEQMINELMLTLHPLVTNENRQAYILENFLLGLVQQLGLNLEECGLTVEDLSRYNPEDDKSEEAFVESLEISVAPSQPPYDAEAILAWGDCVATSADIDEAAEAILETDWASAEELAEYDEAEKTKSQLSKVNNRHTLEKLYKQVIPHSGEFLESLSNNKLCSDILDYIKKHLELIQDNLEVIMFVLEIHLHESFQTYLPEVDISNLTLAEMTQLFIETMEPFAQAGNQTAQNIQAYIIDLAITFNIHIIEGSLAQNIIHSYFDSGQSPSDENLTQEAESIEDAALVEALERTYLKYCGECAARHNDSAI